MNAKINVNFNGQNHEAPKIYMNNNGIKIKKK